jgi:hypothetical protein
MITKLRKSTKIKKNSINNSKILKINLLFSNKKLKPMLIKIKLISFDIIVIYVSQINIIIYIYINGQHAINQMHKLLR